MSPSFVPTTRYATLDDIPEILRILQAAYPRWPAFDLEVSPSEHLRWKMTPPLELSEFKHLVVLVEDEIAAVQLRWLGEARVGDIIYVTDSGCDLAVHPDYRGRGLARLINSTDRIRLAEDQHIGFDAPSKQPSVRHMEPEGLVVGLVRNWTRPLSFRSTIRRRLRPSSLPGLTIRAGRSLAARGHRRWLPPAPGTVSTISRFDERVDDLYERAGTAFDVLTVRTSRYLNWRHCDPRAGGHTTNLGCFDRDRRLIGYATFKRAGNGCSLVDLLIDPAQRAAGYHLLEAGIRLMRSAGVASIGCWLSPDHPDEPALSAMGFLDAGPQQLNFGSPAFSAPAAVAMLGDGTSRQHITMSDFDFV